MGFWYSFLFCFDANTAAIQWLRFFWVQTTIRQNWCFIWFLTIVNNVTHKELFSFHSKHCYVQINFIFFLQEKPEISGLFNEVCKIHRVIIFLCSFLHVHVTNYIASQCNQDEKNRYSIASYSDPWNKNLNLHMDMITNCRYKIIALLFGRPFRK